MMSLRSPAHTLRPSVLLLLILLAGLLSPGPSLGQTPDTLPQFRVWIVPDQVYVQDEAIPPLTLPEATGGNGTLTYTLVGKHFPANGLEWPEGLVFDPDDRTLRGTPTVTQQNTIYDDQFTYTYTATDEDGAVAVLDFEIAVRAAGVTLTASPAVILEDAGPTQVTITATLDASVVKSSATTVALAVDAAPCGWTPCQSSVGVVGTDYTHSDLPRLIIPAGETTATGDVTVTPTRDDTTYTVGRTLVLMGTSPPLPVFPVTLRLPEDDELVVTTTDDTTVDPAFEADYKTLGIKNFAEHLDAYSGRKLCNDREIILPAPIHVGTTDLSLREAILLANFNPGADTIRFAASIAGQTITLAFDGPDDPSTEPDILPPLCAGALEIDGPLDNTGQPTITLDGRNVVGEDSGALGAVAGFYVITDAKTIRGLKIKNFRIGIVVQLIRWIPNEDAWTWPTSIAHNVITHDTPRPSSSGIVVDHRTGTDGRSPSRLSNLDIRDNTIEHNAANGIVLSSHGRNGGKFSRIRIFDNTIQDNTDNGIYILAYVRPPEASGLSIDNLTIRSNRLQRNRIGIFLLGWGASNLDWTNIQIENNTIGDDRLAAGQGGGGIHIFSGRGTGGSGNEAYSIAHNNRMDVTLTENLLTGVFTGSSIALLGGYAFQSSDVINPSVKDNYLTVTLDNNTVENAGNLGLYVIGGNGLNTTGNTVILQGSSTTLSGSGTNDLYVRGGVDRTDPPTSTNNVVVIDDSLHPVLCGAGSVNIANGDPSNTVALTPTFCDQTIPAQGYTPGTTKPALTLPAARGVAPLRYTLVATAGNPDLPTGLIFDDGPRTLTGGPLPADWEPRAYTYTVTDGNGVERSLPFSLTVAARPSRPRPPSPPSRPRPGDGGDDDDEGDVTPSQFFFENPAPDSFQSGLGVISGWVCDADTVEIVFEHGTTGAAETLPAAYGTSRQDTVSACGHPDTGFGLLWNWNLLGDGDHTVRLMVDGAAVAHRAITVTTLGVEFREGVSGECTVDDFPTAAATTALHWSESLQNFVIGAGGRGTDGSGGGSRGAAARFFFENPAPDSFQSGLGIISGWVCDADTVEIVFEQGTTGEAHTLPAAYGTSRQDTVPDCGHPDTGFGLLWNWNLLGDGDHTVRLVVDGTAVAWSAVTVTTLGVEFREGGSGECTVADFPAVGETVTLEWQQASQNFVITATDAD